MVGSIVLAIQVTSLAARAFDFIRDGLPIVVSHGYIRDFEEIEGAIKSAAPGGLIVVDPGEYEGGFTIDKPVRLIGKGARDVTVSAKGAAGLVIKSESGSISNVRFRYGEAKGGYLVYLEESGVLINNCEFDCRGGNFACIGIRGGMPSVRLSKIKGGGIGALMAFGSRAVFENNEISDNVTGIAAIEGANPRIISNRISRSSDMGLSFQSSASGQASANDIFDNRIGISIQSDASIPEARGRQRPVGMPGGLDAPLSHAHRGDPRCMEL